jgi:hypothetical protein
MAEVNAPWALMVVIASPCAEHHFRQLSLCHC